MSLVSLELFAMLGSTERKVSTMFYSSNADELSLRTHNFVHRQ